MILQSHLPYDLSAARALPGVAPLGDAPWFPVDEAYAPQMAERERLLRTHRTEVIATDSPGADSLAKTWDAVLGNLPTGFVRSNGQMSCPDGRTVVLDPSDPFVTLGRLVQSDICLMEKRGEAHVLTGAVVCFPASWSLAEKIGHPLSHIHGPVAAYTDDIARRVQRLFDGVRFGRPIWRFNALWYADPTLFQPRSEQAPRPLTEAGSTPFLRSERQVIWRLPDSDAVLFTIHSLVLAADAVRGMGAKGHTPARSAE